MAGEGAALLSLPITSSPTSTLSDDPRPSGGSDSSVFSTLNRVFSDRLDFGGGCEGGGGRPGGPFWPLGGCELAEVGEALEEEGDLGVSA